MSNEYKLSKKYKDFIKHNAPVECLEGTTAAGKTTVGILKFMLQVAKSKKKQHVIAAKTTGVAEKNIIQKEYGITGGKSEPDPVAGGRYQVKPCGGRYPYRGADPRKSSCGNRGAEQGQQHGLSA